MSIREDLNALEALADFARDSRPQAERERDALSYVREQVAVQLAHMACAAWELAYERSVPDLVETSMLQAIRNAMGLWNKQLEATDWLVAIAEPETLAEGHRRMRGAS